MGIWIENLRSQQAAYRKFWLFKQNRMQEKDRHNELQIALDGDSVELVLCRCHL